MNKPALRWGFNHFVVLNGFCRKGAVLNDPARGCTMVSVEELDEMFTGVCLMFEPGEDFRPLNSIQSQTSLVFSSDTQNSAMQSRSASQPVFEPGEDFRPGGAKRSIAEFARKRLEGSGAAFLFVAATTAAAALVGYLCASKK